MRDLAQLDKLEQYLKDHNIPYERFDNEDVPYSSNIKYALKEMERHQICVPCYSAEGREWDAICQRGSYGAEEGLLEIYGSIVSESAMDSVEGWLTAEDVIKRIEGGSEMKLKPCPFCGKPVSVYYSSATKGYYAVHSDEQNSECIVLMPLLINGHHLFVCLDDAIKAWNKRAEVKDERSD